MRKLKVSNDLAKTFIACQALIKSGGNSIQVIQSPLSHRKCLLNWLNQDNRYLFWNSSMSFKLWFIVLHRTILIWVTFTAKTNYLYSSKYLYYVVYSGVFSDRCSIMYDMQCVKTKDASCLVFSFEWPK